MIRMIKIMMRAPRNRAPDFKRSYWLLVVQALLITTAFGEASAGSSVRSVSAIRF
jgi:hypothetical protein